MFLSLFSNCGLVVNVLDFHLVNSGSTPAVTHMNHCWCQEGHPARIWTSAPESRTLHAGIDVNRFILTDQAYFCIKLTVFYNIHNKYYMHTWTSYLLHCLRCCPGVHCSTAVQEISINFCKIAKIVWNLHKVSTRKVFTAYINGW